MDFRAVLSSLRPHAYFTVTINMNGTTARGVTQHRRDLIKIILHVFGVVFCQELPEHFERIIEDLMTEANWDFVRVGKEAGVIWDTSKFNGTKEGFRPTDPRMRRIREEFINVGRTEATNLLSRAAFVKLTTIKDNISFVAVSYHGEKNNKKEDERYQIFRCLIEFVQQLSQDEGNLNDDGRPLPFLIGGNFNFTTLSDSEIENIVFSQL